eukprot:2019584-Rhodomonas_salina.1
MGTWGRKLQSTVEKAREKETLGSSEVLNLASRTVPRSTDSMGMVLRGLVQWSTIVWSTGEKSRHAAGHETLPLLFNRNSYSVTTNAARVKKFTTLKFIQRQVHGLLISPRRSIIFASHGSTTEFVTEGSLFFGILLPGSGWPRGPLSDQ